MRCSGELNGNKTPSLFDGWGGIRCCSRFPVNTITCIIEWRRWT